MKKGSKTGIVCCSNGQLKTNKEKIQLLLKTLSDVGLNPVCSDFIYEKNSGFSGTGKERAKALMDFFENDQIDAIFDISGGDIALEVLPYLNFDKIAKSKAAFWGYSDLTTIINAIYAKTGKESCLWQIRNLIYAFKEEQIENFKHYLDNRGNGLFEFKYKFLRGNTMSGIAVGGNIRCLLKLAGTEYWPDMNNKLLFLEGYSGEVPQMVSYINQLKLMGVFNHINGILLGTFTKMEEVHHHPTIEELILDITDSSLPVAKTNEIGHGADSKCLIIGRYLQCKQ